LKCDLETWKLCCRIGALAIIFLTTCLGAPPALIASDGEDSVDKLQEQTEAAAAALGAKRFFVMPVPIHNPTIGTGLALSTMYLLQAGENAPPSSLSLGGFYTDTESWAAALGAETYFKDDKYRAGGVDRVLRRQPGVLRHRQRRR
jgi:hypothetical protein